MDLIYNVSQYAEVLAAMQESEISLIGAPGVDVPLPWTAKIRGTRGASWFELQFKHDDTIYFFSSTSREQKWGTSAEEVDPGPGPGPQPTIDIFSYGINGLVPGPTRPSSAESRVLRADGRWIATDATPTAHSNNLITSGGVRNALDAIDVPTNTSQLTNDSHFQTDAQVTAAIAAALADIAGLEAEIVDELPAIGNKHTIYLVRNSSGAYNEYLWVGDSTSGTFEQIGTTEIELSDYYTKMQIDALLSSYYSKQETDRLLADKVTAVVGKGLSTCDYTEADAEIVANISTNYYTKSEVDQRLTDVDNNHYTKSAADALLDAKQDSLINGGQYDSPSGADVVSGLVPSSAAPSKLSYKSITLEAIRTWIISQMAKSITSASTDAESPTSKAVWNLVANKLDKVETAGVTALYGHQGANQITRTISTSISLAEASNIPNVSAVYYNKRLQGTSGDAGSASISLDDLLSKCTLTDLGNGHSFAYCRQWNSCSNKPFNSDAVYLELFGRDNSTFILRVTDWLTQRSAMIAKTNGTWSTWKLLTGIVATANSAVAYSGMSSNFTSVTDYSDIARQAWRDGGHAGVSLHMVCTVSTALASNWYYIGTVGAGFRPANATAVTCNAWKNGTTYALGGHVETGGKIRIWVDNIPTGSNVQFRLNASWIVA